MAVLADHQWSVLEPLLNEARPRAARPIRHFRRTIEAIVWRQQNGAKWRAIPAELGPWWMAAQTFLRWARLGVWIVCVKFCKLMAVTGLAATIMRPRGAEASSAP